jgi:hypothetical protein
LVIPDDNTFFCQIREDLKDPFAIGIQGQLKSHHQVWDFPSDHVKFKFQNGVFYCDGFLYGPNGLAQLQVLHAKHDALATCHFGFNKTMELVFKIIGGHNFENM